MRVPQNELRQCLTVPLLSVWQLGTERFSLLMWLSIHNKRDLNWFALFHNFVLKSPRKLVAYQLVPSVCVNSVKKFRVLLMWTQIICSLLNVVLREEKVDMDLYLEVWSPKPKQIRIMKLVEIFQVVGYAISTTKEDFKSGSNVRLKRLSILKKKILPTMLIANSFRVLSEQIKTNLMKDILIKLSKVLTQS
jgi:hypothetical protein